MEQTTHMGMNRTGMQMSPRDSSAMQNPDPDIAAEMVSDSDALEAMRSRYIEEAEALGSVPAPASVKGMVNTGVSIITGNDPRMLLDKLGERLAFERTGTRLYDALLVKCETEPDAMVSGMTLAEVQEIRDDELRHFHQVADAIESLGGDPTAQTPSADLAGVAAMGLMQVLSDPRTSLAQSLHALLSAEMTDNAGWEMLIALAEKQGQNDLAQQFRLSLESERRHLQLVHQWLSVATLGTAMSGTANGGVSDTPPMAS
jgi:rubrerythrin